MKDSPSLSNNDSNMFLQAFKEGENFPGDLASHRDTGDGRNESRSSLIRNLALPTLFLHE